MDTKDDARAGRACAQGARPARRPVGHGGLRTPCFGEGALTRPGERPFSTKTRRERKGLGTSPFGAKRLTTVPIPCVSHVFLRNRRCKGNRRCKRNRRLRRLEPIRGRLPPAGRSTGSLEVWRLGSLAVGHCPTPRQGEVLPAPPARLRCAKRTPQDDQQEIQEIQEIQERPASGRRRVAGTWGGAPPRTAISQSAHKEMQERVPGERAMDRPPLYPSPVGAFCSPFSVLRSLGRPCRPIQSANQAR